MKVVKKPLSALRPAELNVRIHPEKQITEYKRSLAKFGQIRPMVIDEAGNILVGNGMYQALQELGWTEAYCQIVSGLSEKDKKKLMLSDNRIFNLGTDDMNAFDEILLQLDHDFDIPGYDAKLLQTITIDVSGADEIMAGYGLISEESKEEMRRAAERYEEPQLAPLPAVTEAPAEELKRPFTVCPKCGEKIWL